MYLFLAFEKHKVCWGYDKKQKTDILINSLIL